jgi:hypothetical protein
MREDGGGYGRALRPNYNPDYCLKIARWTAAACLAVLGVELLVLVIVDPNATRCPGWIMGPKGSAHWLYMIGTVTGIPTLWVCFVVFQWDYFSDKVDRRWPPSNWDTLDDRYLMDVDMLWLYVCIGWFLFSTIPFWGMLAICTDALDRIR